MKKETDKNNEYIAEIRMLRKLEREGVMSREGVISYLEWRQEANDKEAYLEEVRNLKKRKAEDRGV